MTDWLFQIGLVTVAVCLFRLTGRYRYYDSKTTCNNRDDDVIKLNHPKFQYYEYEDPCKFFSSEYTEAREKFRTAVNRHKTKNKNKMNHATTKILSFPIRSTIATVDEQEQDSDDKLMTIDVAILNGNTKELGTIVHSSGVHGVEGYAGSAIQLAILELLTTADDESSSGTTTSSTTNSSKKNTSSQQQQDRPTIILLHAVNPVGMSEYRRCNENNVDLNRNCIIINEEKNNADYNIDYNDNYNNSNNEKDDNSYSSFEDFISQRDPNIAGYDDFRHLFVPEQDDDDDVFNDKDNDDVGLSLYETTIGYYVKAIPAIMKHGLPLLKKAMVAGQYHHQGGLNYGGEKQQQSIQHLAQLFRNDHPEFFLISPSVTWIDVHTGLGPSGKDSIEYETVALNDDDEQQQQTKPFPKPKDYFSATSYSFTTRQESSTMSGEDDDDNNKDSVGDGAAFTGYDLTKGFLTDFFADSYRRSFSTKKETDNENMNNDSINRSRSGIFMTQEFGTIPSILVGRALILDNMQYQQHLKMKKNRQRRRKYRSTNSIGDGNDNDESINDDEGNNYEYRSPFLKHAFYPQSTEWKKSIIQRGVALFLQGIEYNKAHSFNR